MNDSGTVNQNNVMNLSREIITRFQQNDMAASNSTEKASSNGAKSGFQAIIDLQAAQYLQNTQHIEIAKGFLVISKIDKLKDSFAQSFNKLLGGQ